MKKSKFVRQTPKIIHLNRHNHKNQIINFPPLSKTPYLSMADTIKFQTVSLIFSLFLGDSIIAITLLSPCAVTPLSTHTLEVNL